MSMFENSPALVFLPIEDLREKLGDWATGKDDVKVLDKAYNLRNKVAGKFGVKVAGAGTYVLRDDSGATIERVQVESVGLIIGDDGDPKPRRERSGGSQENPFDF